MSPLLEGARVLNMSIALFGPEGVLHQQQTRSLQQRCEDSFSKNEIPLRKLYHADDPGIQVEGWA